MDQTEAKPVISQRKAVDLVTAEFPAINAASAIPLIRERYGVEVRKESFSALKSQCRKDRERKKGNPAGFASPKPSLDSLVSLKTALDNYPGGLAEFVRGYLRVKEVAESAGGFEELDDLLEYLDKLGIAQKTEG